MTTDTPRPFGDRPTVDDGIAVEIVEGCKSRDWDSALAAPSQTFSLPALAFVGLPRKYASPGVIADRSAVFLVRARVRRNLPAGDWRILVRAASGSRLFVDGRLALATNFVTPNAEGHEAVPEPAATAPGLPALPIGHQERIVTWPLAGGIHDFRFEVLVGSNGLRHEIGQPCVAIAAPREPFCLLTADRGPRMAFAEDNWNTFVSTAARHVFELNRKNRRQAAAKANAYWDWRHALAREEVSRKPTSPRPDSSGTSAAWGKFPLVDDDGFLRRVTLDTIGVLPTPQEISAFQADRDPGRRGRLIDRLLADDRWADNWVGYWQDVLAENPGILKAEQNNTGPFRWWIYEAFLDNKPLDRFATELITLVGSLYYGGPAGFAMASQNDAPLAEKAHIIAKAFLGLEMKCARCHDAPYHPFAQHDLFSLAAMLDNRPLKLPKTSTVPIGPGGRKPLVTVSLKPGESIAPAWPPPLAKLAPDVLPAGVVRDPRDFRERFAALVTSSQNERFAQVLVNRVWKRYVGAGLIEPVDDWNENSHAAGAPPPRPALLDWLARELVSHDYDLKHVARLILNSDAYQRVVDGRSTVASADSRRVATPAPARRRMSAEQIVDSLFAAVGKPFGSELLTMDPEIRRGVTSFFNLGSPARAWQFTSLSNDRDRPALALPVAQSAVDVLTAFGWRDNRTNPISVRDEEPTALQPLTLANGILGSRIVRLSDDSLLTADALQDQPVEKLVDAIFLRFLSRVPRPAESKPFVGALRPGYESRIRRAGTATRRSRRRSSGVSWSNHLSPEASRIKLELERAAREGDPPTDRLEPEWRERMEDVVWAVVNSPEFVFIP